MSINKENVNPQNSAIITMSEFERIKDTCSLINKQTQYKQSKSNARKDLNQKSKSRYAFWPNTIEALRKKKEDDRVRKLEDEEIARRKQDSVEEEYKINERNIIINKSNVQAFERHDKVKAFKTKMLLCDVGNEQKQQMKLQRKRDLRAKQIEEEWVDLEHKQMANYDVKLKQKLENEYNKKMDNCRMIKNQLEEFKDRHIKSLQEEMLEGEMLKRQVEDDIEKERLKEQDRIDLNKKVQEQQIKANRELEDIKRMQKEQEIQEEQEIANFAKKKDRLDQLRKEKEADRMKKKQDERQKQIEYLNQKQSREDEILSSQIREAELRAEKEYQAKEKKRKQMEDAIEVSRKSQIHRKQVIKERECNEDIDFAEYWKVRNQELHDLEERERLEELERNKELERFRKNQYDEKQKIKEKEFRDEQRAATKTQALIDHQEEEFYSYAERCIKEWKDQGKNVTPLLLELKKKSFLQ